MRVADGPRSHALRCRRILLLGVGLALAMSSLCSSPAAARPRSSAPPGGIGLRLVDTPVATRADPRTRLYIVDHLAPGAIAERRIEVSNTTDSAREVVLYAAAATIDDGMFLGAEDRTRNDVASWTTVRPSVSTVAAGGTARALVTLALPTDAVPGEQYGVVWAEVRSASTAAGSVTQVSRVGLRLYISVGPGGAPASDFRIESFTAARAAGGAPVVTATVTNTGGRALDLTGTLKLANGPGGLSAGPFPADPGSTLAIGDTRAVRITLDRELPDGPWDAVVTLRSGLTERRAEASLSFPSSGASESVAATRSDRGGLRPRMAGAVGLVALLAAAGCVVQIGRRDPRWKPMRALWSGRAM